MSYISSADFERTDSSVRCQACGHRKGEHGGHNNPWCAFACPSDSRFPRWSWATERVKGKDAALARYDRSLARFWTRRTTTFVPWRL